MMGKSTRVIALAINANTNDYNIATAAGSPTDKVYVTVTIASGVTVGQSAAAAALMTGAGWAVGSKLRIVNGGTILGKAGFGGAGGDVSATLGLRHGENGTAGSDAVKLDWPLEIDNGGGYVFGGGGGGGGGGAGWIEGGGNFASGGGGGGGGGAGNAGAGGGAAGGTGGVAGAAGSDGSASAGGSGGAGGVGGGSNPDGGAAGNGGGPGAAGADGISGGGDNPGAQGFGGAAGKAISLNGHAVTFTAGNNSTQVKGAVA